jgi:hypothetical protein
MQRWWVSGYCVRRGAPLALLRYHPTPTAHDPKPPLNLESPTAGPPLSAESGAFSISGLSASLKYGRRLVSDAGSFVETGGAASLELGTKVAATAGSLAVTGSAVSLNRGQSIPAAAGAISVDGLSASLKAGRAIPAAAGAYTLSGSAIRVAERWNKAPARASFSAPTGIS